MTETSLYTERDEKITGTVNAVYSNAINMTSCLFNNVIYLSHKQVCLLCQPFYIP